MGSGGMIVMDENTCMVDIAKYFLHFLKDESCGKCTPCRVGITQMHAILTDITEGRGKEEDLQTLQELAEVVRNASLCLLGGTAPNPVLTTLRYFKDEYLAHIRDHRCPAHVCKPLIRYSIDPQKCKACGMCLKACPQQAVSGEPKKPHIIESAKCIRCGACFDSCKFGAVVLE
jgi:ferredoxin